MRLICSDCGCSTIKNKAIAVAEEYQPQLPLGRAMPQRTKPPFRADHVGSLIRPRQHTDARHEFLRGRLDRPSLQRAEDEAVCDVIAMQERLGLRAVTDGEFRRTSWREGFFENVDGFSSVRQDSNFTFRFADGSTRRARPIPRVVSRLRRRTGIATAEFEYLSRVALGVAKITLPAPSVMHWFGGDAVLERSIYPDTEHYLSEVSALYREEIADLVKLGCTYLQLDEVALPIMADRAICDQIRQRGEDPDKLIELYISAINNATRDCPATLTVCLHMCRGNEGEGMGSAGYDPIAERVLIVSRWMVFFSNTTHRGPAVFYHFRFMPPDKTVALGLISTKLKRIETMEELRARVDEAGAVISPDQLCLSPQCGFASGSNLTLGTRVERP
jgi:methionine synthase II (cobalamin-independent)